MINGSNFKRSFVAKNCARTAGITAANLHEKLAPGEMLVLNESGAILSAVADIQAAKGIKLVQGASSGSPLFSQTIWKKDVSNYKSSLFTQVAPQKIAFGYNGTAGSIEVLSLNSYAIGIEFQLNNSIGNGDPYITRSTYESLASGDTQFNIANKLAQLLSKNFGQFNEAQPIVNVVTADAGDAANSLTACEVVKGSRVVSIGAVTLGSPTIGQAVIVPGLAGGIYGDEASGVYQITAVDLVSVPKTITLDKEYRGTSQASVTVLPIVDVSVANYGVLLETAAYEQFNQYEDFLSASMIPSYSGFGVSTITLNGSGFDAEFGYGRHEQVRNSEQWHQSYWGRNARQSVEFQNSSSVTIAGNGYSSISFISETSEKINTLETNGQKVPFTIYLDRSTYENIEAVNATTGFLTNIQTGTGLDGVAGNSILNVLNTFMVSAEVVATGANTVANGGNALTPGITNIGNGIDV
ncbi:hypothetical protein KAU11_10465 [Candidatus Babeliales bacterium]|nr:hypothetical protein [Candidatus Babeliales bacterium]